MEYCKFIVAGEDRKSLASIKNLLVSNGHIFVGYVKDPASILRNIRGSQPDLVIMDLPGRFMDYRQLLEVVEEDLLSACILVLEGINDEIHSFLSSSRVTTYIRKPVFNEVVLQIADLSIMNFRRILEYEDRVKKLNDTLESRKAVEKAKWILVQQESLTEAEAYEAIKRKSRNSRVPMREIAEALILTRG